MTVGDVDYLNKVSDGRFDRGGIYMTVGIVDVALEVCSVVRQMWAL